MLAWLCFDTHAHRRLHVSLIGLDKGVRRNVAASAGLAAMLGEGTDPQESVRRAKAAAVSVRLDQVTEEALKADRFMPELFSMTKPVMMGDIDAFVSHSWADDGERKYYQLRAWGRRFANESGRQPRLWIDKWCLDQKNIADALPCLQILLVASQDLVLLFGPTFVTASGASSSCSHSFIWVAPPIASPS